MLTSPRIESPADDGLDEIILDISSIMIVGGGPMGLLAAVKFKLLGVENVALVSKETRYTRSHPLNLEVFNAVARIISPLTLVKPPKQIHLKDIEKQLHQHALDQDVEFINKKFDSFASEHKIILVDHQGNKVEIDTHFIIDCTGGARFVLNEYIKKLAKFGGPPPFVFSPLHSHGPRFYCKMRVLMPWEEAAKFQDFEYKKNYTPKGYALGMEELRKFGWEHPYPPECYRNMYVNKKDLSVCKAYLYMQLSEKHGADEKSLSQTFLLNYAGALCKLYNNEPYREFVLKLQEVRSDDPTKKKVKTMINTFWVHPKIASPAYRPSDKDKGLPFVTHFGDSSSDLPFPIGKSFSEGAKFFGASLNAFTFKNGKIVKIDVRQWKQLYATKIQKNIKTVAPYYQELHAPWKPHIIYGAYVDAYVQSTERSERKKIEASNLKIFSRVASVKKMVEKYTVEAPFDLKNIFDPDIASDYLQHRNKYLREAIMPFFPTLSIGQQKKIRAEYHNLALSYEVLGDKWTSLGQIAEAESSYIDALMIHLRYFEDQFFTEKAILYVKLVTAAAEQNNHGKTIFYADEFISKILPKIDAEQNKITIDTVYYYFVKSKLAMLDQFLEAKTPDYAFIKEKIKNIGELMRNKLPKQNALLQELNRIKQKFLQMQPKAPMPPRRKLVVVKKRKSLHQ